MGARTITLCSDFGNADWFVAAMKGVLHRLSPASKLIDLMHEIPAHELRGGSFAFAQATNEFAPGCVHLCVVDPGVGSARAAIALRNREGSYFVGPDNGILSRAAGEIELAVALPIPPDASSSFHGRDVFAPAAARLASGEELSDLGVPVDRIQEIGRAWERRGPEISAAVIWIDRFGNLISDLPISELPQEFEIAIGTCRLRSLHSHYAEVAVGEALAYAGSCGTLEIALREASASHALAVDRGDLIKVYAR